MNLCLFDAAVPYVLTVCSSEAVFTVKRTLLLPDPDVGSRDARVVYIDMYYVYVYVDIYICTYIYVCYMCSY